MEADRSRCVGKLGLPRYLVFGHDLGIASDGYAVIDLANHEILEVGSQVFKQPVNKKHQSLAAVRRGYRGARRNIDRTQDRLRHVIRLLVAAGVMPEGAGASWLQVRKGEPNVIELRAAGLDRRLSDRELAKVLYSLAKRRGYIPHGGGGDADEGKVLKALGKNDKAMAEGGYRTVGEWLASRDRCRNRDGDYSLCVRHSQIVDEARAIFEAQAGFGNDKASPELLGSYLEALSWERDTRERDALTYSRVGTCTYFPEERRAARACLDNELAGAWAALGNVTVVDGRGGMHLLTHEEKQGIIDVLFSPAPIRGNKRLEMTYGKIRDVLGIPSDWSFKGVSDEKREPFVPRGWRALYDGLHGTCPELLGRLREDVGLCDDVVEALAYASSVGSLADRIETLDLDEAEREAVLSLPYQSKTFNGYCNRSHKALGMLLECLEEPGCEGLTEAEEASGLLALRLERRDYGASDRLMPYEGYLRRSGKTNTNPTVIRAVSQMRRVTNRLISKWGMPDEIHVELARELRQSKRAIEKGNRRSEANRKANEEAANEIAEALGVRSDQVSDRLVKKRKLYEDQGGRDIYTDAPIDFDRLLENEKYCEIDHVLPESRTGDNSWSNLVLCLRTSNQLKSERTPYEWMNSGEPGVPEWEDFRHRVLSDKRLWQRKRDNLLNEDLEGSEAKFIQRNINDTSYMSREVCAYLKEALAWPEDKKIHVRANSGNATAWLRHAWGLNFGKDGEKDRDDDRHHGMDAIVIAACSASAVQATARMHAYEPRLAKEERAERLRRCLPWPGFADEARAAWDGIEVRAALQRKGTGQIFNETVYSSDGKDENGKYVDKKTRKPHGTAVPVDGGKAFMDPGAMVCLRLWHDPEARGGKGAYYADPVYLSDMAALKAGTYRPRICTRGWGRDMWEEVPERLLGERPIVIYSGDRVELDGKVQRFIKFNSSTVTWLDAVYENGKEKNKGLKPSIRELNNMTEIKVLR